MDYTNVELLVSLFEGEQRQCACKVGARGGRTFNNLRQLVKTAILARTVEPVAAKNTRLSILENECLEGCSAAEKRQSHLGGDLWVGPISHWTINDGVTDFATFLVIMPNG